MVSGMDTFVSHQSLDALVAEATSPQRWRTRSQLASEWGYSPTTLSMACAGKRPLSPSALDDLLSLTGWARGAVVLPAVARPGDLETVRLTNELRLLRERVSDALLRGTDEVAQAIRERTGD